MNHRISNEKSNPPYWTRGFLRWYFYWRTQKIRKKEHDRLKSIEQAMETIALELAKAKAKQNIKHQTILNLSLYVLTIEYDMSVVKLMIPFELDKWHQRFLGRQMAVLMYESTNDLLKLLGKEFSSAINLLHNLELQSQLNEIRMQLNEFKKSNLSELEIIRNFSAAHRDNDAFEQLVVIKNLDVNHLLELTSHFMKPIANLTPWCSKVMSVLK
jgi:hypothetical protein